MINKKLRLISLSILSLLSMSLHAQELIPNPSNISTDPIVSNRNYVDKTNEYIINPNIKMLRKFQWADWKDSAGGRLARDPAWFLEISDKYKTKEIPFDWSSVKNKTALEKRNAYFNHLCNTEASAYETSDMPVDLASNPYSDNYNLFIVRKNEYPIKDMESFLENYAFDGHANTHKEKRTKLVNEIFYAAQQNPYLFPEPGFYDFEGIQGRVINFFLREPSKKDIESYKTNPKFGPKQTVFREYMDQKGSIYRVKYDFEKKEFLPLIKVEKTEAEYYTIFREIERPEMKKLGIYGKEIIWVRKKDNKILHYIKQFIVPGYLDSTHNNNFKLPINWSGGYGCRANNINSPRMLKNLESLQN